MHPRHRLIASVTNLERAVIGCLKRTAGRSAVFDSNGERLPLSVLLRDHPDLTKGVQTNALLAALDIRNCLVHVTPTGRPTIHDISQAVETVEHATRRIQSVREELGIKRSAPVFRNENSFKGPKSGKSKSTTDPAEKFANTVLGVVTLLFMLTGYGFIFHMLLTGP